MEGHTGQKMGCFCSDRNAHRIERQAVPWPLLSFLWMLFAVTLTGIFSWKEDPDTVLATTHHKPGADG